LDCLATDDVGKFYVHLVKFSTISYILWPFGIFCGDFGIFFRFGMFKEDKAGNRDAGTVRQ
jgi:hypothetical protein